MSINCNLRLFNFQETCWYKYIWWKMIHWLLPSPTCPCVRSSSFAGQRSHAACRPQNIAPTRQWLTASLNTNPTELHAIPGSPVYLVVSINGGTLDHSLPSSYWGYPLLWKPPYDPICIICYADPPSDEGQKRLPKHLYSQECQVLSSLRHHQTRPFSGRLSTMRQVNPFFGHLRQCKSVWIKGIWRRGDKKSVVAASPCRAMPFQTSATAPEGLHPQKPRAVSKDAASADRVGCSERMATHNSHSPLCRTFGRNCFQAATVELVEESFSRLRVQRV